jgi:hypothetical protein
MVVTPLALSPTPFPSRIPMNDLYCNRATFTPRVNPQIDLALYHHRIIRYPHQNWRKSAWFKWRSRMEWHFSKLSKSNTLNVQISTASKRRMKMIWPDCKVMFRYWWFDSASDYNICRPVISVRVLDNVATITSISSQEKILTFSNPWRKVENRILVIF